MAYRFLSPEWIAQVRAIREEHRDHRPVLPPPAVRANLVITGAPEGEAKILAHTDTSNGNFELGLGHLDEADITVTLGYDIAKQLVIEQNPAELAKAWLFGRIRIDGDLTKLLPADFDPVGALNGINVDELRSIDPVATEMSERIRAITA